MQALEEGRVHLHEPLSRWLPIPSCNAIGDATPRQLLLHVSGLPAGRPLPTGKLSLNALVGALVEGGLENPPESVFTYSDIGFHLLAALVETVFERPLDELARDRILNPIGMVDTDFGVPPEKICRVAPTEMAGETMLCGQVHDPAARSLGGVAGHAGLFGTARDLARFCRMVLGRGQVDGIRILQSATLDAMIAPVEIPGGNMRALGWDVDTRYSNPRGDILPVRGVGHTGFTGPSFWIDPATGIFIILATNRLHPDGKGDAVALRRRVANVVAAALLD
jgi:CubicO group peptidase (beta-lactamase class C family)